jgi:ferredoxin
MKHLLVYCSPAGSTRRIAERIEDSLQQAAGNALAVAVHNRLHAGDGAVDTFDLGDARQRSLAREAVRQAAGRACLWVGSPVYVEHAVPPVEQFLAALPPGKGGYAVAFVTWGAVTSGIALYEMGHTLTDKGYVLLGAAKVVALHSSMWKARQALGQGHPDGADEAAVAALVDAVASKFDGAAPAPLPLRALDYQPAGIKHEAQNSSIAMLKQVFPKLLADEQKCSRCGLCAENCPAQAITLEPYPIFGQTCFLCLRCVRECPEEAMPLDTAAIEAHIRSLADRIRETPLTQIFH